MAKPQIKKIMPFDAAYPVQINIIWNGNRACKNRVVIRENETLADVYDKEIITFSHNHTISGGVLTNGKKYIIQCQVFDEEDTASPLSDELLFYTFQTPEFKFYDLENKTMITSSSYSASILYRSADWEDISNYKFYLYDNTKKLLLTSNTMYSNDDLSYIYRGLENNKSYYIRCMGSTVNGMLLDTGYQEIQVKYENPSAYARIFAENDAKKGCINLSTNLIIINYSGDETFTYEDGMINLMDKTLVYNEGFLIDGDFTVIIRGIHLYQTREILKMSNAAMGLILSSRIYSDGSLRYKLSVPNGLSNYILYSDKLDFTNENLVTICIRRKNNLYQLKVFVDDFVVEGNYWYGFKRPGDVKNYDIWIDEECLTYMVDKETMMTYEEEREPEEQQKDDLWIGGE